MERVYSILLTLAMLAAGAYHTRAQDEVYAPLPAFPFVYVSHTPDAPLPAISDSLFDASSRGVRFRVNRSELRPDDPFVSLYKNQIVPLLLRQPDLVLRHIVVRGAASPEGPYENNCRLGHERVQALAAFLGSQLGRPFDPSQVECSSVCEDYAYLVRLMQEARDPDAEAVARIWQQSKGDERACKARLKRHNGGRTWRRLLKTYFPTLRQARVLLFFGRVSRFEAVAAPARLTAPTYADDGLLTPAPTVSSALLPVPVLQPARLPLMAVRTNLVHDFFYMPDFGFAPSANVQLEFFPRKGHFTYNLGFTFGNHRHWSDHKFFQIRDAQVEVRRYFRKGHPYRGAYLAAYGHGFSYGFGLGPHRGWKGEGLGAGLSGGYTFKLTRNGHLRMEAMAALGFLATQYDPFVWGNPVTGEEDGKYYYDYRGTAGKFRKRNHRFTWLGPTNLGLQLTYDLVYRKREKGGRR